MSSKHSHVHVQEDKKCILYPQTAVMAYNYLPNFELCDKAVMGILLTFFVKAVAFLFLPANKHKRYEVMD